MSHSQQFGFGVASLAIALLVVCAGVAGAATAFDNLGPAADETPWFGDAPDVVEYSVGSTTQPSFLVTYENGTADSLTSWANVSSDRAVKWSNESSHTALVAAPPRDIGASMFAQVANIGLVEDDYVESVSLNTPVERPEPVQMQNLSDIDPFGTSWKETAYLTAKRVDSPTTGIADRDSSDEATLQDARNVTDAANATATGENVTVAVIDTGANTANGRVFGNGTAGSALRIDDASASFVGGSVDTVEESGYDAIADGNGHGTWTAAAVAANTTDAAYDGVAPDADLLVLKALDDEGSGETANIARAVRYAEAHDADVISMSLGSPVYNAALDDAIADALDGNTTVIAAAAGNSRQTTRWVASPADVPEQGVVAVGASNATAPSDAGIAYFSQLGGDPGTTDFSEGRTNGAQVDVSAPGVLIEAKVPTTSGSTTTETLSGTSMATPLVGGGAAVAIDANEEWQNDTATVVGQLRTGATAVPNAGVRETGTGMVDIEAWADPDTSDAVEQTSQRSDAAEARDTAYRTLERLAGSWFGGVLA